jgi:hypothetical protein
MYQKKIKEGNKSYDKETLKKEIIVYLKRNRKIKVNFSLVEQWIDEQLSNLILNI